MRPQVRRTARPHIGCACARISGMRTNLRGQRVLITGAGSGIGRLLALGVARRGGRVVIWDLDTSSAAAVRDEIRAAGAPAESFAVDVSDAAAVATAGRETGPVDVLINNAGVVTGKPLLAASEEAIRRTFEVNTLSLYWVTRAFLPGMIERGRGSVVTIASAAALLGVARQSDYSASKAAAFTFAESLRVELAKDKTGVTSLVVCPYYIDTGMFAGVRTRFPRVLPILEPQRASDRILRAIERGRAELLMPQRVMAVRFARLLPVTVFDRITAFLGLHDSMDAFTGRTGAAERKEPTTTDPA